MDDRLRFQVKDRNGKISDYDYMMIRTHFKMIKDDDEFRAMASIWILIQDLDITDKPSEVDTTSPTGDVHLFWHECRATLEVSSIFEEILHQLSMQTNGLSIVTDVTFLPTIKLKGESTVYSWCVRVTFSPIKRLKFKTVNLKQCTQKVEVPIASYRQDNTVYNPYVLTLKYASALDISDTKIEEGLDKLLEKERDIVYGFQAFCHGISFPKTHQKIQFHKNEYGKTEEIMTTSLKVISPKFTWTSINLVDYVRLKALGGSNCVGITLELNKMEGTIIMGIKSTTNLQSASRKRKASDEGHVYNSYSGVDSGSSRPVAKAAKTQ